MTSDPFSHGILSGLFSDAEVGAHFSSDAMLQHMMRVEIAYTRALGQVSIVPPSVAQEAGDLMSVMQIDMARLHAGMRTDGVSVPALVREIKRGLPEPLHGAVHAGMTSQDVIDTSMCLTLDPVLRIFDQRLITLIDRLGQLIDGFGANPLQGRTRMQAALPICVADRAGAWRRMVAERQAKFRGLEKALLRVQLGGPVGTGGAFGGKAPEIARDMAERLNLGAPENAWHTNRIAVADLGSWSAALTGILGKFGADITLMAQQGIDEVRLAAGGGSSAMPHKSNPVLAELLVTLARYNATQLPGLHHALVHEQERSGSAWTLEWMILPAMMMATGRAIVAATELCDQIEWLGTPPTTD